MDTNQVPDIRTYELFEIVWDDGGGISGYRTRDEAMRTLESYDHGNGRTGQIIRKTWQVEVDPKFAHIYQPGI